MLRRCIALIRDYSHRRSVFGHLLNEQPLHLHILSKLEIEFRGCLLFALKATYLLGLSESAQNYGNSKDLIRIIAPLVKLYPCKVTVGAISECMECIGGTGYMEDSRIPQMLRDSQAVAIWEGTTNVCSMDVIRAIITHPKSYYSFIEECSKLIEESRNYLKTSIIDEETKNHFKQSLLKLEESMSNIQDITEKFILKWDQSRDEPVPKFLSIIRTYTFSMARCYVGASLIHYCLSYKKSSNVDFLVAKRWCDQTNIFTFSPSLIDKESEEDRLIALDIDDEGIPRGCGNTCKVTGKLRHKL